MYQPEKCSQWCSKVPHTPLSPPHKNTKLSFLHSPELVLPCFRIHRFLWPEGAIMIIWCDLLKSMYQWDCTNIMGAEFGLWTSCLIGTTLNELKWERAFIMNYLLWGLYIQHSATLGVFLLESKEEKIIFPEGSLHNVCVHLSAVALSEHDRNPKF